MGVSNFNSLLLLCLLFSLLQTSTFAAKKSYIVYLGCHSHGKNPTPDDMDRATNYHHEFLGSLLGSVDEARDSITSTYNKHINGFAAILEEEHAEQLAKHPKVVSVFPNEPMDAHTTHSWQFLGLENGNEIPPDSAWNKGRFGEDVIIGGIDSGVWPESKSFSDEGMGPVPSKWRGICQNDTHYGVSCNRKLLGHRFFNNGLNSYMRIKINASFSMTPEYQTARDFDGHGTHILSTAGGSFVANVSAFGHGYGTAKGGSPKARVANYKACWNVNGNLACVPEDTLNAFDAAINDGVDVISASVGNHEHKDYIEDGVAIGSFHAMMHGIIVVAGAANAGPAPSTVANVAPWLLTVGASSTDRLMTNEIILGNKKVFKGQSLSAKGLGTDKLYPLILGIDAKAANATDADSEFCNIGAIDPEKVKGKIVVCLNISHPVDKSQQAAEYGAAGMIIINHTPINLSRANPYHLPASMLESPEGREVVLYTKNTKEPVGTISDVETEFNAKPSPTMADFSSRGPSKIEPAILKPDVAAPGVNIIAAFTEATGLGEGAYEKGKGDTRRVPYMTMYGTSMSCPHVSGIAGLVKTQHSDWSPAAIRSAIMTTAETTDSDNGPILDFDGNKATPFAYGAGHINPNKAMDPGLVYDLSFEDYMAYICGRGYNQSIIDEIIKPRKYKCPESFNIADFNYPSIAIPNLNGSFTVTRRVKNVGSPACSYKASITEIKGVSTLVEPSTLDFTKAGEEKTFKVTFNVVGNGKPKGYVFGELIWSDGSHNVKSPIAVKQPQ